MLELWSSAGNASSICAALLPDLGRGARPSSSLQAVVVENTSGQSKLWGGATTRFCARHSIFSPRPAHSQGLNEKKTTSTNSFPHRPTHSDASQNIHNLDIYRPQQLNSTRTSYFRLCAFRHKQWLAAKANQLAERVPVERLLLPMAPRSNRATLLVPVYR